MERQEGWQRNRILPMTCSSVWYKIFWSVQSNAALWFKRTSTDTSAVWGHKKILVTFSRAAINISILTEIPVTLQFIHLLHTSVLPLGGSLKSEMTSCYTCQSFHSLYRELIGHNRTPDEEGAGRREHGYNLPHQSESFSSAQTKLTCPCIGHIQTQCGN